MLKKKQKYHSSHHNNSKWFYFLLNLILSAHFKITLVLELAALPLARPAVPLVTF